jgi:hypothetical protein
LRSRAKAPQRHTPKSELKTPTPVADNSIQFPKSKSPNRFAKADVTKPKVQSINLKAPKVDLSTPTTNLNMPDEPSIKAPKADLSLSSAPISKPDVATIKAPKADLSLPSASMSMPEVSTIKAPKADL